MKTYDVTVTDTVLASSPEEAAKMLAERIRKGEETTYEVIEAGMHDTGVYSEFITLSDSDFFGSSFFTLEKKWAKKVKY